MVGHDRTIGEDVFAISGVVMDLAAPGNGAPITGILPIAYDTPQEPEDSGGQTEGIGEIIGNDYVVKRILGKCFVSCYGSPDVFIPFAVRVTAGIFVARADEDEGYGVPLFSGADPFSFYSPQANRTIREPWMWRRDWILNPTTGVTFPDIEPFTFTEPYWGYPRTNAGYGSVLDGPHVDVKSRRRIKQDERLYFTACAQTASVNIDPTYPDTGVRLELHVRAFGQLTKPRNQGSF